MQSAYYDSPNLVYFTTRVDDKKIIDKKEYISLEKNYFFPGSYQQEPDSGTISSCPILERRSLNSKMYFLIDKSFNPGEIVSCRIDYGKRVDRMRQHSAAHILKFIIANFYRIKKDNIKIGENSDSLEILNIMISKDELLSIEQRANKLIWMNLNIRTYFVKQETIKSIPINENIMPSGYYRIAEIDNIDFSQCECLHCKSTSEIGFIKITNTLNAELGSKLFFNLGIEALKLIQKKLPICIDE